MSRKLYIFLIVSSLLIFSAPAVFAAIEPSMTVNGVFVTPDVKPFAVGDVSMIELMTVANAETQEIKVVDSQSGISLIPNTGSELKDLSNFYGANFVNEGGPGYTYYTSGYQTSDSDFGEFFWVKLFDGFFPPYTTGISIFPQEGGLERIKPLLLYYFPTEFDTLVRYISDPNVLEKTYILDNRQVYMFKDMLTYNLYFS